ncbi:MAG: DUF86 domain-containing protein [Methanomassiliicoccaceae archaeon]|nr:DUF86 domain-containing protein [Methanomassiliicoccaceae archaeon]
MASKDISILQTIVRYCTDIENAVDRFGNDKGDFLEDTEYQYACSFCISQIGEVVKRLSLELTERYTEIEWSEIAKMRDFLNHSYHNINLSTVWEAVTEDAPLLKEVCERILRDIS